jgi:hypothetical protein
MFSFLKNLFKKKKPKDVLPPDWWHEHAVKIEAGKPLTVSGTEIFINTYEDIVKSGETSVPTKVVLRKHPRYSEPNCSKSYEEEK